jgi:rubrerythrin
MKRLIVKYNRVIRREEMDKIETKVQKEWKEREAVILPECCDYEIIDDGVNEAAIWLDQEIEKRKAAVEEKNLKFEGCITWKCPRCGYTFYNQDETASIICPNCKTKTRREHEDRQSKD